MPAGFNIQNFRAHTLANGFAKPNKFFVRIPLPFGFNSNPDAIQSTQALRQIEFWAEAASLPGISLASHRAYRYGYGSPEHRPIVPIFTEATVQFLSDGRGEILGLFQRWIKMIANYDMRNGIISNDVRTGSVGGLTMQPYEISYRYEYVTDLNINVFNESGTQIVKNVLREAIPLQVADTPLNWGDTQNVSRVTVVFGYTDWYSELLQTTANPTPYQTPSWADPTQNNTGTNVPGGVE